VAVEVLPATSRRVMAPVHESEGKLEDVFPVDCAKYWMFAVQVTVVVLPVKTQLPEES
jgi:hypothetical protein